MNLFNLKIERLEKCFAWTLVVLLGGSLLYALLVILFFTFHSIFPNLLPFFQFSFSQLRSISENILRFFGLLLMLITLFEFFRRAREYLPEPRPNPRSLLASFGIVIITSLMASILIFSNLQDLTKNVGNLISVGIVMGIGVAALIFVYKNIPHVLSKMWIFTEMRINSNNGSQMTAEINGFIEYFIKIEEEKKESKAIKTEVIILKAREIDANSIKVYSNKKKIKEVRINSNSFYWITKISKSEILRYNFKFNVIVPKEKKIIIHIEDENGRDITLKQKIIEKR